MSGGRPLVVAICGPTATGKTEAGVSICEALSGEVISMDSMQVFRGLSIGTAKATPEEMRGIPHHMLSFLEPDAVYTAAEYQRDARRAMAEVLARGKFPVFVGGTGLYLQAVSHPLSFADAGGAGEVRERLRREAEAPGGAEALHARLTAVDAKSAERLHVNNVRRVIRALEIYETTGAPMSEKNTDWAAHPAEDWLIFALTWPRETLYARIHARVDRMMATGLIEEVRGILAQGVPKTAQSMQAIGYKEIIARLNSANCAKEAADEIKMNSRRYAKRQLTWFRRDPRIRWVDLSERAPETVSGYLVDEIRRYNEYRRHQEESHAEP